MHLDEAHLASLPPELASRVRELEVLVRSARRLNESLDLKKLLVTARDLVRGALGSETVCLLQYDEEQGILQYHLAHNQVCAEANRGVGPTPSGEVLPLRPGEGLAGWVFEKNEVQRVDDASKDPRVRHERHRRMGVKVRQILAVPLRRGGKVIGVLVAVNKEGGFTVEDERLMTSLSDNVALALENALLYRTDSREKLELESIYRIGLELGQTLELREILPRLLELLREVIPYDAAAIYLVDSSGIRLEVFLADGYDEESESQVALKLGQGAVGWVATTGKPLIMADVTKDSRYFNARSSTRSELVVPMLTEGRVIGAFNLESDHIGAFEPSDVKLLTTFGAQAAVAIERARLHEELMEKWRLEEEIRIARTIQERLFPRVEPEISGFDVAGLNVPSLQVSGDLYDYFTVVPGHVGIMIADVAGKGVPAALVGATLRASLRTEIQNTYSIETILSKVNGLLLESLEPARFVTGVYGVLDVENRRLTYSSAGHNPPLWLRSDGTVEWLTEGGTVLGAYPQASYKEGTIELARGDVVVLYTDGITEAVSPGGAEFGSGRLVEVVRREREGSAGDISRKLIDAARLHEGPAQADDLTVLTIKALEHPADGYAKEKLRRRIDQDVQEG